MKKITTTLLALTLGVSTLLAAETSEVNTGKGFYMGAGMGASFYNVALTEGSYYLQDDTTDYTIEGNNLEKLDDSDLGYVLYAGYLFNKIIGVEGAFTDYGSFSGTADVDDGSSVINPNTKTETFTKDPMSMAVYANAGYTFFNGQLRPFGLLGLGYMKTNQSQTYKDFQFQDDFMTLHYGFGVDYYPTVLKGFGVRASYVLDSYADYDVDSREDVKGNTAVKTTTLWQNYSLFYVSAQYKF